MPHCFAYDRQRHVVALGYARPAVPRDVGRQPHGRVDEAADDLEVGVDDVDGVEILPPAPAARCGDDGQQVRRAGRGVAVDDVLHRLFPLDGQQLAGLLATVDEEAAA